MSENPIVWAGSLAGYASVGYLIYKQLWKEKPRLSYEILNKYWYPPEENNNSKWYTIFIELLLRNRGERNTTVNSISISFNYNNKLHFRKLMQPKEIPLPAGHSESQECSFSFHKNELEITGNPKNVKLKIISTHNEKKKTIDEIP